MDIKEAIVRGQGLHRDADKWGYDRAKYLNASEADDCVRKLWYSKHGTEEEPQEWGFAYRGHYVEKYVVDMIAELNDVQLMFGGGDQRSIQDEKRGLSATPDGELIFGDDPAVGLEVKSIDPRVNVGNLPREGHVTQFRIAMALRNNALSGTVPPLTTGLLVYVDASNYNSILSFEIEPADEAMLDKYASKSRKIFRTKDVANLDREGKRTGGCKYCPFRGPCGVTLEDGVRGRSRVRRGSNLDGAAQEYMAIKDAQDDAKARMEALKEDIKGGLEGRPKVIVGDILVTLQTAKGRETLDKKAVKAAGIDLSPFTKTGAPSERLTLKRI